uniref:Uncharacterized protein n=1 Tax=Tetraselmis sp. GSL018 TaxID=582737 RepID=A0A061QZS5_9CHLO
MGETFCVHIIRLLFRGALGVCSSTRYSGPCGVRGCASTSRKGEGVLSEVRPEKLSSMKNLWDPPFRPEYP